MADIDGPDVAEDFYTRMFRQTGDMVDFRDSATALNVATWAMRRRKGMTIDRWINFVHIGASLLHSAYNYPSSLPRLG